MVRFDIISGIVMFLVFGGAFLYARGFHPLAVHYVYLLNIIGMVLSAVLILSSAVKVLRKKLQPIQKISGEAWVRIGITTAAIILYSLLLNIIGYIFSTALYGASMILYLYLGKRTKQYIILTIVISVGTALLLYFIFGKILYVWLP